MLALIVIAVGLIYLLISVLIVTLAWRAAKRRGVAGWKWGLPAALVVYLLVFWDHIPTLVAHKYYCDRYAGFTVYKTVGEWKEENPKIVGTLDNRKAPIGESTNTIIKAWINQRLYVETRQMWLIEPEMIGKTEKCLVDSKTDEKLACAVDFWRGNANPFAMGAESIRGLKFWLYKRSCGKDASSPTERFYEMRKEIYRLGDKR